MMIAIVAIVTSCTKSDESFNSSIMHSEDFTGILGKDTRTILDGTAVKWCSNDLLTIFTKTSHNRKYKIKSLDDNGCSATFEYESYTGADNSVISSNYALYPYDICAILSGDVITTTIAAEQNYNAERTDLSYALMVAKSDNTTFTFSNAGALLRFNISKIVPDSFTLKSITLSSAANKLSGEVTINTATDCKAIVSDSGSNEVALTNINTAIPDAGLSFHIALPATTFAEGDLSVTFNFTEGIKQFVLPAFDLTQGKIKTIKYTISDAEDFTGNTPGNGDNADDEIPIIGPKPMNNEIWYTATSKVEPYYPDKGTFGATIISNVWDETTQKGIITFDDVVKLIESYAFYQCKNITSITIPDSVTTIGTYAFNNCDNLTNVIIGDSVTTIGASAFNHCDNLTSVTIGNSVTTIGVQSFNTCKNLTSVTIPDSVTTIGREAFDGCDSLTSVTIGDSVTEIGVDAFYNCKSLRYVYCKATTPPSLGNSSVFYGNATGRKIYVPASDDDSIINAYKTKSYWKDYQSSIFEYEF